MGGFCEEPDHVHFGRMWRTLKLWTRVSYVSRDEQALLIGAYETAALRVMQRVKAQLKRLHRGTTTLLASGREGIPMLFGQRV